MLSTSRVRRVLQVYFPGLNVAWVVYRLVQPVHSGDGHLAARFIIGIISIVVTIGLAVVHLSDEGVAALIGLCLNYRVHSSETAGLRGSLLALPPIDGSVVT